ncbi:chemotaxis response regulator protein-glutamate methylesterase [Oxalobacteraceae bacterium A2-2]
MSSIQVMIVDDSAVARQVLAGLLNGAGGIQVSHALANPQLAMQRIKVQRPDVIVLDVDMPHTDGLGFLRTLMLERLAPVVVCSALSGKALSSVEGLTAGAAVIVKPRADLSVCPPDLAAALVAAVRAAASPRRSAPKPMHANTAGTSPVTLEAPAPGAAAVLDADAMLPPAGPRAPARTTAPVVAIGASTGGTQALEEVLAMLPIDAPGIVIVQHMPERYTGAFAERLDSICRIRVKQAAHNDRVQPGLALIAPGGRHMLLRRDGGEYVVDVVEGPLVNRHRPSVDVLFRSVARCAGANALGVILTGMGDDGAAGLLEMLQAGARTVGQDEASCVVYGMPQEAMKLGAVEKQLPLQAIHREIEQFTSA